MRLVITVTLQSGQNTPVDVTWSDESMPESIRTKVVAVRMDIYHDAPEGDATDSILPPVAEGHDEPEWVDPCCKGFHSNEHSPDCPVL